MANPLVSICIPTYNRASMVGKAIESALDQTYRNIEVIVVDNASTDNIEEVVGSYYDPRLRLVKNKENLGLFGNFNRCIEVYSGLYLHILHSDDYIDSDFTEKCVSFFEENPNVYLTCTSSRTVSDTDVTEIKSGSENFILKAPEGFRKLLSERCFISCPSVMVRKGLYEKIGKFSLEYPYSSDYNQWLKVSRFYDIGYISDAWINYRVGDHSESYRLLFKTPLGYMDTLKIHMTVIGELGGEVDDYYSEINHSLKRFIGDCIYAGFVRSDKMDNFRPGIFIGMAMTACLLLVPKFLKTFLEKLYFGMIIVIFGIIVNIPLIREIPRKIMIKKSKVY